MRSYRIRRPYRVGRHFSRMDRVIVFSMILTAVLFVALDSPASLTDRSAWAISNRFASTDLSLPSFLQTVKATQVASSMLDLPEIRRNGSYAWGGAMIERDFIRNMVDETPPEIVSRAPVSAVLLSMPDEARTLEDRSRVRVTSGFGYRRMGGSVRHHDGIDISMPYGAPIFAHQDGVVSYAGWRSGYGYLVIIDHEGGKQTYYAHASRLRVTVGDVVTKGTPVASAGSTGRAFGTHLHFEIRYDGVPVDPESEFLSNTASVSS